MHGVPEYVKRFYNEAKDLLASQKGKDFAFSKGTYQVEIQVQGKEEYPFFQVQDDGTIIDSFCSCRESEKGMGCIHLAIAYLKIFRGEKEPLHVRFQKSLWNRLSLMASKRHGLEVSSLQKQEGGYGIYSETKKRLFSLVFLQKQASEYFSSISFEKEEETEENSIKFSNLSLEEIEAYKKGEISPFLLYELSFWSDFAKWLMLLQEDEEPYEIFLEGLNHLLIRFPALEVGFYISKANWSWILPSLQTLHFPLEIIDREKDFWEKLIYEEKSSCIRIEKNEEEKKTSLPTGVPLSGGWSYVSGKGFYREKKESSFSQGIIPKEKIGGFLSEYQEEIKAHFSIFPEPKEWRYAVFFDEQDGLHIRPYIEEEGDLSREMAALFPPWAYVPNRGFFLMENWLFEEKEKLIPKERIAEFVNSHRHFLQGFPAFQTHLGSLESHITYEMREEGLVFQARLNFPEGYERVRHFDEWVHVEGRGFYRKKEATFPIHPGLVIPREEISDFIHTHRETLEQVPGFFLSENPMEKMGLEIELNEEQRIHIQPKIEYKDGFEAEKILRLKNVLYVSERGFSEIPAALRVPEKFSEEVTIPEGQESSFLSYEMNTIAPFITRIDRRLRTPEDLHLKIRSITPGKKKGKREWLIDLYYSARSGFCEIAPIWEAFSEKKRHHFSLAGLLFLHDARFQWIRHLARGRFEKKRKGIWFSAIEWIRLMAFEKLEEGFDQRVEELNQFLGQLHTEKPIDISFLQATLRPYQEEGIQWLWFLYSHGLSGLLCDDMGLGKTHQAMALLAGIFREDRKKEYKYLVVCPTSVLYHWEQLLKRFLPSVRVLSYWGSERTLELFEERYDLLLTSYGILRAGKESVKQCSFELAIFDEIQVAKNYASQTHHALTKIRAKMRLGLSGTPIENRLRELKSLFDVILPGYMPSDATFKEMFTYPIEKMGDHARRELLKKLISPFILRRKKEEVLFDLPEKIEEIAYSDLSEEQRGLYEDVASLVKSTFYSDLQDQKKPIPYVHIFSALAKLKQICNHPSLYLGDPKSYIHHRSGKWDLFVELLDEALESGQKIVIFSQYLEMLSIIEMHLKKKKVAYAQIIGATQNRAKQLEKFQTEPDCRVFLASLLAAGVGIDLSIASIVIHYDRWWNPAKENQATDRVHRIGQSRGVQVFKLVAKDTIEEKIHEIIEAKKGLAKDILEGADGIHFLSKDELLEVIRTIGAPQETLR